MMGFYFSKKLNLAKFIFKVLYFKENTSNEAKYSQL